MTMSGRDVLDIGKTRVGQTYVFGATVPLDNPLWQGPWDCAEFASWCAYQAYGLIFGAGGAKKPAKAEPYSGYWYADAKKYGHVLSWQEALAIPGAALIRAPAPGKIGHVAFTIGDGDQTLEARGAKFGVGIFGKAKTRSWTIGCLLPGVEYGLDTLPAPKPAESKPTPLPAGFLWLRVPNFKGADIVALQQALKTRGIDPGPVDGEFGPQTQAAVLSFQLVNGLEVDGIVGPATAAALGLGFPIAGSAADAQVLVKAKTPANPGPIIVPPPPAGFDGIAAITQSGSTFSARTQAGESFIIGSSTTYTDDMVRVGLYQGKAAIQDSLRFGVYKGADFTGAFGQWAHFIEPTLSAEGGARFATLNSYDRAAFTFGAPQLAAHTPRRNFVVYFRQLLALPDAGRHFPELELRKNAAGRTTIHQKSGAGFIDLEAEIEVTRPNGKKEVQLPRLMAFLNSSPVAVDQAELSAAARLMNWLRLDPQAKALQIAVFIDHAKDNLATAKQKVPAFDGKNWEIALWIMDIRHQGRGTYAEIKAALASPDPAAAIATIGAAKYGSRIKTVRSAVAKLKTSGVMTGFTV